MDEIVEGYDYIYDFNREDWLLNTAIDLYRTRKGYKNRERLL